MANNPIGLPSRPWRVGTSKGGNRYIYDANDKVVIVPNVSGTGKTKDELVAIYNLICTAVNAHHESQLAEQEAWKQFDAKGGR